ncbi:hypothetical protein H8356DRAFT_1647346 [Neocallimastix lanati (nom. inval.)]|nr:hypothetical protein H8356DRAFT_1647346 [Neocallimastix sp. JGI-2020a]
MKELNILYCYLVHGLDRSKDDYGFIKQRTEELFGKVFENQENKEIQNLIYCYCSTSHTGLKSRDHLIVTSRNDFIEFKEFFENTIIKELNDNKEKYNNFEGVKCNIYISISGHSLGGLISRGLIKNIFSVYTFDNVQYDNYLDYLKKVNSFITDIKPCSFLTLSSPHLGSLVSGASTTSSIQKKIEKIGTHVFCDYLISNIGKELVFKDDKIKNNEYFKDNKPILYQFCEKEYIEDALAKFPNRTLTGFLRYDLQVKYCTAFACIESPLEELKQEKDSIIPDENKTVDTRIIAISGYNDGPEFDYYKKGLYNEKVLEGFYYDNTRILEPPNIDEQIKQNLIKKGENPDDANDESKNIFLVDNECQSEIPIYILKKFNSIPYRRVSIDLLLPRGLDRVGTHGACLGTKWTIFDKECIRNMAKKTVNFYSSVLIADFIWTSGQNDLYSL